MWEKSEFIKRELDVFEEYLKSKYKKKESYLNQSSRDIIFSGGKRIRPALIIISGMLGNYDRSKIFPVAAALETLHTATLIHDDIIDSAKTRRGKLTVSEKNGINIALYTGDYLLANSMLLLSEAGLSSEYLSYVAKAAKLICSGEVNQYFSKNSISTVPGYLRRIMKKTGILFSASCALGAYVSGCDEGIVKQLGRIGMNIGIAFQIRDDILDISSDTEKEGKPVANDIKEGIVTLPFIFAAQKSLKLVHSIKAFFNSDTDIGSLIKDVVEMGGLDDSIRLKKKYISRCEQNVDLLPLAEIRGAFKELLAWM